MGNNAPEIKADVSQESEVSEMVERVSTRFDRIDVLVNNAGIEPYFALNEMDGALRSPTTDLRDPIMKSRLGGTYVCTKHVLPIMKQQHSGHIINVYGAVAGNATDGYAASASRDALQCFTSYVANQVRECERLRGRAGPGELSDCRGQRFDRGPARDAGG